ncbi:LON peptidase substrate-binding domain-containing protein [Govanella unica]|uniref:LON peptidase substrate-binding domain-containing protein n=1 Tax=Govanella unica TaxID=2975056 RepID=A0A9X3TV58_9PROT|nr:LON peptidase substrate-binding domain-containing protein [Govania unica]MDA5192433.1 LON peptidase substrate-binding domain-containing protein [Govania unica]
MNASHSPRPPAPPEPPQHLPRVIPIFPLAGALLLPRATMPLNIFEPRYLAMCRDAIAADGMIGMVQPRDPEDGRLEPAVYDTGCLGHITEHRDMRDGRMLITVEGVSRFTVLEELAHTTPYRQVVASYEGFAGDRLPPTVPVELALRQRLVGDLKRFLDGRGLTADWDIIGEAPDETLVNTLAMICPFESNEKQALLEAATLDARALTMVTILEFALAAPDDTSGRPH